ncbi:MAG: hypothetical protein R3242_00540 [Akkermansiaceae bacterium]|nr:hypothetical protein [Akkermansiaceae bacterium]
MVDKIRERLQQQLERLKRAARDAQQAATDPDSKAESKYDTRNLEASYLAAGQARQVEALEHAASMFERLVLPDYEGMGAAGPGALIELKLKGESEWFLLVPAAGGLEVMDGERTITLLSPESPLYQQLLGCGIDQVLDRPAGRVRSIL